MVFYIKDFILSYFLKPLVAFCGLIAIYGHVTEQPIEPMISTTLDQAYEIGDSVVSATSEAIPVLIAKIEEKRIESDLNSH